MATDTAASTALTVLSLARLGRFAEIRELFAPQLLAMVSAEALQAAWDAELTRCGPIGSVGVPITEPSQAGVSAVKIPLLCEHDELILQVSVHETGPLVGLQLLPADAALPPVPWEAPDYAAPATFTEHELLVGSGPLAVPGTLSLPEGAGPLPAIVLLGGSGPTDRDSTIGENKPFKDLAWGLASAGVAVLRFDKGTYAHRAEFAGKTDLTLDDEYVRDARAAIHLLGQRTDIDGGRIFVLGHSLGGTVAPRVAAEETTIAGLVILAGGAQPLHWAIVRQLRYIAALNPQTEDAAAPAIEAMSELARRVDSPDLSPSTPASELPFGIAASYWLDLRGYNPVAVAASLDVPMFILQGGRDYQATVSDDLALWRDGLAQRNGVTIRIYDADNHFFFVGSGPSSPAEYGPGQHVDPEVVADIAEWIAQR